jgi:dTDP-4-dehydrorhamnose 3,5-epimerase
VIFRETELPGVFAIESEPQRDPRGSFQRVFCKSEFRRHGLDTEFDQESVSTNPRAGTVRGLHFQAAPHEEVKIVTCVTGALFDVVVDLRPGLHYGKWAAFVLEGGSWRSIYIPKGCAHGFQTLADDTSLLYRMNEGYRAEDARGVRWNDPSLGIPWPKPVTAMSDRDAALPHLSELNGLA